MDGDAVVRRYTWQREAVLTLLRELEGFHTPNVLHEELRKRGQHVGLTTVYRTLQILVDLGSVDVVRSTSGETRYRRCGDNHHHHLMCRRCGRVAEVVGPAFETWTARVADEHGFSDIAHTLEIFGTCPACAATSTEASEPG